MSLFNVHSNQPRWGVMKARKRGIFESPAAVYMTTCVMFGPPVVYLLLAESVVGEERRLLEGGLSRMPGLRQVQCLIDDTEHTAFAASQKRAKELVECPPPILKGRLTIRWGTVLPATL